MLSVPLPPKELRFMNENDSEFLSKVDSYLNLALEYVDPKVVLDLGCGYGRFAYALMRKPYNGQYLGMDILPRHIRWLRENISTLDPRYQFQHIDIHNSRYNRHGKLTVDDIMFPENFKPDLVVMLSLFTHMLENEIRIYLERIREILEENSIVIATFFSIDGEGNPGRRPFSFDFVMNDHCRYHSEKDPLHAIAYKQAWLYDLFYQTGLKCLDFKIQYQDIAVLIKR